MLDFIISILLNMDSIVTISYPGKVMASTQQDIKQTLIEAAIKPITILKMTDYTLAPQLKAFIELLRAENREFRQQKRAIFFDAEADPEFLDAFFDNRVIYPFVQFFFRCVRW